MELTQLELKELNRITHIKTQRLKTFFSLYNPPYTKNKRKEHLYKLVRSESSAVGTLNKFKFFLDNVKCRRAEDIKITSGKKFKDVCPELFNVND